MDNYLTIGEFAKLRNIDRKSLRYYERIGALIPAYTDPSTKYRYYTTDQLVDLDTILMCLELGIPLKQATQYRNDEGTLDTLKLFNDGKHKVNEKLLKLYSTMARLERSIRSMEESGKYKNNKNTYKRYINKRYVLRTPFTENNDKIYFEQQSTDLFVKAKNAGLYPVFNFPIGLMFERNNNSFDAYIILEFLYQNTDLNDIYTLPEGEYICYQEHSVNIYNPSSYCSNILNSNPDIDLVIVTNMTLDRFEKGIFPLEIQYL